MKMMLLVLLVATLWVYEHCVVIAIANAGVYIVSGLQIMIIGNYMISWGVVHGILHSPCTIKGVYTNFGVTTSIYVTSDLSIQINLKFGLSM